MANTAYRHSQVFKLLWILMPAVAVVSALIVWFSEDPDRMVALVILAVVNVFVLLCLGRLVVEIDATRLKWSFGWLNLLRWEKSLADIAAVEKCTVTGVGGSGIKVSREGWVYSAGGATGVRVTMRDGKRLRIGSDDHERLASFLSTRIASTN
jgi:hypothetical protein